LGTWTKRLFLLLGAAVIAGGLYVAMRPRPTLVDIATVKEGPMEVSVEEEGVTRVREIYAVSSPIEGHLDRLALEEGDPVEANKTVVASIHPLEPPFINERTRTELVAAIEAARSAVALAKVERARALTALELAQSELRRTEKLAQTNIVSQSTLEKAQSDVDLQKAQVESADATIRLREAELASAKARLTQPGDISQTPKGSDCCINITAPVDGVVLKVIAKSAQAVVPGTKIAEIGNPRDLEILVDLLSSDATRISPGAKVRITDWGGEGELQARVRKIEPAGFTKVSALGIEEQRVNAVLDLDETPPSLGDGYRVLAHLVVWSSDNVLQVPIGALFRSNGDWSVFKVVDGIAHIQPVEIEHLNDRDGEVLGGLENGDQVVLYPSDVLEDGGSVDVR
jgi:HlyD family secretion protein